MAYRDDDDDYSSSTGSKTPMPTDANAGDSGYFAGPQGNVSPSSKSPGIDIPSPSFGGRGGGGGARGAMGGLGGFGVRSRRSSISLRLDHLRHAGGVNSIDAFARSWTRAATYFEITPSRQSYVSVSSLGGGDDDDAQSQGESAVVDDESDQVPAEYMHPYPAFPGSTSSYGSFGSLARPGMPTEGLSGSVRRHADDLLAEQQQAMLSAQHVDKEREPLLVKTVETDTGIVQQVIVGQSTLPQTVFNSVNVMIGIGLLGLPLGMKFSGWILGMIFLAYCAITTNYTAKLLARCLERSPNQSLVTYSDIAFLAYGPTARILVSILFSLELMAACVALVVLFADSLGSLMPSVDPVTWKIVAGVVLTPLSFLPLRVLSFSSILGILSTVSIFLIVAINGLMKPDFPGSLIHPAPTYLYPQSWLTLPIGLGMLMAPWGGHSVFPNIFKDMRHPHKFDRAINITYWFTYLLDASMMVVGILMFGDGSMDEITSNILGLPGYPESSKVAMVVFIAIIAITKTPLNARPIISTVEILLGIDARSIALPEGAVGMSSFSRGALRIVIRIAINASFVVTAIVCPAFDTIMAFMGSTLCFSICVILPLLFYLKIFGDEVSRREKVLDWLLVAVSSVLGLIGTIFALLPKESLGIDR